MHWWLESGAGIVGHSGWEWAGSWGTWRRQENERSSTLPKLRARIPNWMETLPETESLRGTRGSVGLTSRSVSAQHATMLPLSARIRANPPKGPHTPRPCHGHALFSIRCALRKWKCSSLVVGNVEVCVPAGRRCVEDVALGERFGESRPKSPPRFAEPRQGGPQHPAELARRRPSSDRSLAKSGPKLEPGLPPQARFAEDSGPSSGLSSGRIWPRPRRARSKPHHCGRKHTS